MTRYVKRTGDVMTPADPCDHRPYRHIRIVKGKCPKCGEVLDDGPDAA